MQHEKLYNLHRTTNSTVAFFVFKIDKVLSEQLSTLREVVAQNFVDFEHHDMIVNKQEKLALVFLFNIYV